MFGQVREGMDVVNEIRQNDVINIDPGVLSCISTSRVVADYALIDQQGKLCVLGIFQHVWVTKFPAVCPRTHLVLRVRGRRTEIGVHTIRIRFVDDAGTELLGGEGTVQFGEPPAGVVDVEAGAVLVFDIPLPRPGHYAFEISLDGELGSRVPLTAAQVSARPRLGSDALSDRPAAPSRSMHEYTASDALRKHMYAVELAMRAMAERAGEDPEAWGMVGLVHDFDYERFPNAAHSPDRGAPGRRGADPRRSAGCPSRCSGPSSGTRPTPACRATRRWPRRCSRWTSCAAFWWPARWCVRRGASPDLEVSSVKKKLKDKAFARGREPRGRDSRAPPSSASRWTSTSRFVLAALRPHERDAGPRPA